MDILTVESAKQAVAEKYRMENWEDLMEWVVFNTKFPEIDERKEQLLAEAYAIVDAELEKHRWIPVEEMLPEVEKTVLACNENDKWAEICFITRNKRWFVDWDRDCEWFPTHWRYLPEMP